MDGVVVVVVAVDDVVKIGAALSVLNENGFVDVDDDVVVVVNENGFACRVVKDEELLKRPLVSLRLSLPLQ